VAGKKNECKRWKAIVSTNQRTIAEKVTAEIIINLVDPVSTKTLDGCFTNPTSKAELQLLNI